MGIIIKDQNCLNTIVNGIKIELLCNIQSKYIISNIKFILFLHLKGDRFYLINIGIAIHGSYVFVLSNIPQLNYQQAITLSNFSYGRLINLLLGNTNTSCALQIGISNPICIGYFNTMTSCNSDEYFDSTALQCISTRNIIFFNNHIRMRYSM